MEQFKLQNKSQVLLLLTAMMMLGVSATDIYIASLPQMVIDFHSKPDTINLTLSSFSIAIAFGVLFIGEISSRYGRRNTLITGVTCFTIASFLIAIVPSVKLIIFFRIIQALGCSTITIIPRQIFKDSMDENEQISANGVLLMALIISPAIAPVIGAFLAQHLGWKSCFVFSGIFGAILLYRTYKILPETNTTPISKFTPIMDYSKNYFSLLTNRAFITLTMLYACGVAAYYSFIGISSYLYISYWHFSPLRYSYVFIWVSLAYFLGNLIMRILNKRRMEPVSLIGIGVYSTLGGAMLVIFSAVILPKGSNILIFMVTFSILFMRLANAEINPPVQAKIMNKFNDISAQALGLNFCIGYLLSSLAMYLVTVLPFSPLANMAIMSSGFILLCTFAFVYNRDLL